MTREAAYALLTSAGQPFELIEVEMFGRRCRAFKHAPPTLRELYSSTRSGLPFIVYGEQRLSFEEAWQRACGLAHALHDDYGVRKGDRVAISLRNYPEWMIVFCAATSIGAIAVGMNALWQPHEMEYALNHCGARVLFADQERLDRLRACREVPAGLGVVAVRATGALPPGARDFDEVLRAHAPADHMPPVDMHPNDDAIMFYTSGSTGHPKGAVSSHRNILSALLSWELDGHAAVLTGLVSAPVPGGPQPATLLAIPLFHVTGLHAVFLSSYRTQRRLVSMYKWDTDLAAEWIERERITSFVAPAAMTGDLVEAARRSGRDLSSLQSIGGGGAARAPEQVMAIDRVFANAKPNTGWGMTETNAIGTGIGGQTYLDHPESSGRVSAVLDIRVVDDQGKPLPPMARGELQVRGASVIRGYWNRPDADAATFEDEWLKTGDVACIDEEGFLYIVDRLKDLVIRGGENIGCGAVEAALLEHPAVLEASVYGVPDERLGEELAVTLHTRVALSESDLRAFLEPRLAKFEIPRYFHFEQMPLPRIASGKILKRQLREEAAARLAQLKPLKPSR